MSEEKMRAALEAAREEIEYYKNTYAGGLTDKEVDNSKTIIRQIDEALKSEPVENPDDGLDAFLQMKQEFEDFKQLIIAQSGGTIRNQLLNLPDAIKTQAQSVADASFALEEKGAQLKQIENEVFAEVAKDITLKNEDQRRGARKERLDARTEYAAKLQDVAELEKALKSSEIELNYLHDRFSAVKAIAGMVPEVI